MTAKEFKNIYDLHVNAIRNYIYYRSGNAVLADDITQEAFIKVWEKKFRYDPKKNKSLLYKIANNLFLDYIRRNKVELNYLEQLKFEFEEKIFLDDGEKEAMLTKCNFILSKLTEKERLVFLMSRKDGMKYNEIAACLGISVKTVEKRMSNALKNIKSSQNETA